MIPIGKRVRVVRLPIEAPDIRPDQPLVLGDEGMIKGMNSAGGFYIVEIRGQRYWLTFENMEVLE